MLPVVLYIHSYWLLIYWLHTIHANKIMPILSQHCDPRNEIITKQPIHTVHFANCTELQIVCRDSLLEKLTEWWMKGAEYLPKKKTSSSAMAERPCDCSVLCLRPKSSLCSCWHCQLFCAGLARHQRCRCYSPGKKNKDQLAGLAQQLE